MCSFCEIESCSMEGTYQSHASRERHCTHAQHGEEISVGVTLLRSASNSDPPLPGCQLSYGFCPLRELFAHFSEFLSMCMDE